MLASSHDTICSSVRLSTPTTCRAQDLDEDQLILVTGVFAFFVPVFVRPRYMHALPMHPQNISIHACIHPSIRACIHSRHARVPPGRRADALAPENQAVGAQYTRCLTNACFICHWCGPNMHGQSLPFVLVCGELTCTFLSLNSTRRRSYTRKGSDTDPFSEAQAQVARANGCYMSLILPSHTPTTHSSGTSVTW